MAREPFDRTWAEEPEVDQFGEPTDAMWRLGWEGGADKEPPEAYAQNYWQRRADITLRQLERDGALEWLVSTPYKELALARASDGVIYVAVQDNTGADPTLDDGTNWLSFPDYIKSLINSDGPAPVFGVRAWAKFNGVGSVTLNASGNIASITRVSLGTYDVLFDTPMQDNNYSVSTDCSTLNGEGAQGRQDGSNAYMYTANGFRIQTWGAEDGIDDMEIISLQVVR